MMQTCATFNAHVTIDVTHALLYNMDSACSYVFIVLEHSFELLSFVLKVTITTTVLCALCDGNQT